jgi:hypothetical protein
MSDSVEKSEFKGKQNTIQKNAILAETIKKEVKYHRLYDQYMLSPNVKKSTSVFIL